MYFIYFPFPIFMSGVIIDWPGAQVSIDNEVYSHLVKGNIGLPRISS